MKKEKYFERFPILYITKNIHDLREEIKISAIPRVWEMLITALRGGLWLEISVTKQTWVSSESGNGVSVERGDVTQMLQYCLET